DELATEPQPSELASVPLRDKYGRPIPLIEGYVVRGVYERIPMADEQWQELHEIVVNGYRKFLDREPQERLLIPSSEQPLRTVPIVSTRPPVECATLKPGPRFLILFTSVAAFSALAAIVLLIVLLIR